MLRKLLKDCLWNVIENDVTKVADEGVENYLPENMVIDFVSGGYPCQAFSYAGHKLGLDDVRGTMFYYFAKAIGLSIIDVLNKAEV